MWSSCSRANQRRSGQNRKKKQQQRRRQSDLKVSDDRRKAKRRSGRSRKKPVLQGCTTFTNFWGPRDPLALKRSRRRRQTWSTSAIQPKSPLPSNWLATWVRLLGLRKPVRLLHTLSSNPQFDTILLTICRFPRLICFVRGLPAYACLAAQCSVLTARSSAPMINHYPCRYCRKSWLFCP